MKLNKKIGILLIIVGIIFIIYFIKNFGKTEEDFPYGRFFYCYGDSVPLNTNECNTYFLINNLEDKIIIHDLIIGFSFLIAGIILLTHKEKK